VSTVDKEKSIQESQPYELLRFVYGPRADDIALYTTQGQPVTFNGETYSPLTFDREAIVVSQSLDRAVLAINLPYDSVIAQQYRLYPPVVPVTVTIFRGQVGEPVPVPIWVGRVVWGDFQQDLSIRLECEPITTGFKRVGLHLHYQHICPHVLYETKTCAADREANTLVRKAIGVAGTQVTVPGLYDNDLIWNGAPFRTSGGQLSWTKDGVTHKRTIYRSEVSPNHPAGATIFTLIGSVTGLLNEQDDIEISRGCARTITDCVEAFDNAINFGGFPFIPTEDPTRNNRVFY